ncbi:MAG: acyclic terpene utilization AtuA family protein [Thermodesulfobacteriota bacterium]|nr:acyclic terpene utilization AtuA family protein [Thermodesulfobacteriota bacterium]
MKTVRIAAGSGYAPSPPEPALKLIEEGDIKYIGFDQLAELTISILNRAKMKNPTKGYVWQHIIDGMKMFLAPAFERGITITSNGGGANIEEAVNQVLKIGKEKGLTGLKVAQILGDDVMGRLDEIRKKGWKFKNRDTGEEDIDRIKDKIVAANVYIGSDAVVEALEEGANVIIGGRIADSTLHVAPLIYEFGWKFEEPYWDLLNAAVTIAHIIECSDWCTGAGSVLWEDIPEYWNVGYPIAEVSEDGTAIISKVNRTGGLLNSWTVKEHLVYEVHDPANYIMPDGIADLTTIHVEDLGDNKVRVSNMSGKPRPDTLKIQIGYLDGYITEGMIVIGAPKVLAKAKKVEEIAWEKLKKEGITREDLDDIRIDYIGLNSIFGPTLPFPPEDSIREIGMRVAVRAKTPELAEAVRFAFQMAGMVLVGWTTGGGPARPRPVVALWTSLIPREEVPVNFKIKEVD